MFLELLQLVQSHLLYFALHLTNSNSFPRPLKAQEEQDYLEQMRGGDPAARIALIEHNLRLVAHIVKKYYSRTNDQEDLISIGTIGLIKGIDSFRAEKGTRLSTYCAKCVENEILMNFRNQRKMAQDVYMSDPIDTDSDGNPLTLMDIIADGNTMEEDLEEQIRSEKLRVLVKALTNKREKDIIILRYGLNNKKPLTQREVAQRMNISRSYVSRIEKKALQLLQKEIQP